MIVTYNGFTFEATHVTWIGQLMAATMDQSTWYFEVGLCDGKHFTSHTGKKEDVTLRRDIFIQFINDHRPVLNLDEWIQEEVDTKAEKNAPRKST